MRGERVNAEDQTTADFRSGKGLGIGFQCSVRYIYTTFKCANALPEDKNKSERL